MRKARLNKKIFYFSVFLATALFFAFSIAEVKAAYEDCGITPVAPFYQIKAPDGSIIAQIDSAGNMEINSDIRENVGAITQTDSAWSDALYIKGMTGEKKFVFHKDSTLFSGRIYPLVDTLSMEGANSNNFLLKNSNNSTIARFGGDDGNVWLAGEVCYPVIYIDSCEELQLIGNDPAYPLSGKTYALTQDIDCSMTNPANQPADYDGIWKDGLGFNPIGSSTAPFYGVFSGRNYKISNLFINREDASNVGLFSYLIGFVKNLTVENASIVGLSYVGIMAGSSGDGQIRVNVSNCSVSGRVSTTKPGLYVGGMVGALAKNSVIINSHVLAEVKVIGSIIGGFVGFCEGVIRDSSAKGSVVAVGYFDGVSRGGDLVGGFVGQGSGNSQASCKISKSFSEMSVDSQGASGNYIGGFIGYLERGTMEQCYSAGEVRSANSASFTGGFVGGFGSTGKITNSYSTGNVLGNLTRGWLYGGFVGDLISFDDASVIVNSYSFGAVFGASQYGGFVGSGGGTNSFWDKENSGLVNCAGLNPVTCVGNVSGKTSAEMKQKSTFNTVWDFDNVWKIPVEGKHYPCLKWQDDSTCFANDPIEINSCEELQMIGHSELLPLCGDKCDQSVYPLMKNYIIGNDINCSLTDPANQPVGYSGLWADGLGFDPIGEYNSSASWQDNYLLSYKGFFNGNNKKISNLYIKRETDDFVGLFAYSRGEIQANIKVNNLKLENIKIYGKDYVGGLFGSLQQVANVDNVLVSGLVSGNMYVGGLTGYVWAGGDVYTVSKSMFSGQVLAAGNYAGGLIGYTDGFGKKTINSSYSVGSIVSNGNNIGGLVGYSYAVSINNSYSGSSVTGVSNTGGLVGYSVDYASKSLVNNSYSFGKIASSGSYAGGFVGYQASGVISNSYWDKDSSGKINACGYGDCTGVIGQYTPDMISESSYNLSWLFQPPSTDTWKLSTITPVGNYYPCLGWQSNATCQKAKFYISSCEQLQKIGNNIGYPVDGDYALGQDIDCSATDPGSPNNNGSLWDYDDPSSYGYGNGTIEGATGFRPISQDYPYFSGNFDGNNKKILNLYIKTTGSAGLFGEARNAEIKNIGIINATTSGSIAGGLIGDARESLLSNTFATGAISGNYYVGGLAGKLLDSTIINSYAVGTIISANESGGLIGDVNGSILNGCYSMGSVTGNNGVGGLIGFINDSAIENSYSTGAANGNGKVGGLLGGSYGSSIKKVYSSGVVKGLFDVGGLIGDNDLSLTNSYWNKETSGQASACGYGDCASIVGLTVIDMTKQSKYTGFNFTTPIWKIPTNHYACLNWQDSITCPVAPISISSCVDLQKIGNDPAYPLSGNYMLTQNIDCSATSGWNSGAGFEPIGYYNSGAVPANWAPFTGTLDFRGYKILGLFIKRTTEEAVGLFAYLNGAIVKSANLDSLSVEGKTKVGGLVGYNENTDISNAVVSGTVKASSGYVGGLIGKNVNSDISSCSANIAVALSSGNNIGGLIGENVGSSNISNCVVSGQVNGQVSSSSNVGGLIGKIDSFGETVFVSDSISSASVMSNIVGGGLIGYCLNASIENSSASGAVTGNISGLTGESTGGLIGFSSGCQISDCRASGEVKSVMGVGGLVGTTNPFSSINRSSASGKVSGGHMLGGLVGDNSCPISDSFSSGAVDQAIAFIPSSQTGKVGGLVGVHLYSSISNCYALGNVNGLYAGGLVGYVGVLISSSINNSYSKGLVSGTSPGGFIGWNYGDGQLVDDYWDYESSNQANACGVNNCQGAVGLTTQQMNQQLTYSQWNFTNIWTINDQYTYPCHQWWTAAGGKCACGGLYSYSGDLNGDSLLNWSDFLIAQAAISTYAGEVGYTQKLDYDHDCMVSNNEFKDWYTIYYVNR
jgi:hypothetical protein